MKELLTIKEMARLLKVSDKTFRSYINKYELPYYGARSAARFDPEKVLRKMENHGVEPITIQHKSKLKSQVTITKENRRFAEELGL